jgi:hypothetical protein
MLPNPSNFWHCNFRGTIKKTRKSFHLFPNETRGGEPVVRQSGREYHKRNHHEAVTNQNKLLKKLDHQFQTTHSLEPENQIPGENCP